MHCVTHRHASGSSWLNAAGSLELVKAGRNGVRWVAGSEETIMKKTTLYVRLVREVALTVLVLIKLGQAVYALVGPALNYWIFRSEKLHKQNSPWG